MSRPFRKVAWRAVSEVLSAATSLIILLPLVLIVLGAMKDEAGAAEMSFALPTKVQFLQNSATVLATGNTLSGFANSLVVGGLVTALSVSVSFLASYILARRSSRGSRAFSLFFLLAMVVPGSIVANFYFMRAIGLYGSRLSVILLQSVGILPLIILLMTSYIRTVPREIDESAIVDGSSVLGIVRTILVPICTPVIANSVIIVFLTSWNDFLTPLFFLTKPWKYTVPLSLYYFIGTWSRIWNLVFTDVLLVSLPVVVLYLLLQRYIIAGLSAGAVKG